MVHTRIVLDRPRLGIRYAHRTPDEPTGRFGGGWQFCVGVEVGSRTVMVNLGVAMLRIDMRWRNRGPYPTRPYVAPAHRGGRAGGVVPPRPAQRRRSEGRAQGVPAGPR